VSTVDAGCISMLVWSWVGPGLGGGIPCEEADGKNADLLSVLVWLLYGLLFLSLCVLGSNLLSLQLGELEESLSSLQFPVVPRYVGLSLAAADVLESVATTWL